MRSRTVRPIQRRGQKDEGNLRQQNTISMRRVTPDTQPMYPIRGTGSSARRVQQKAQPTYRTRRNLRTAGPVQRNTRTVRQVRRNPQPAPQVQQNVQAKLRAQKNARRGIAYFDYDLLLVIVFLVCFGLVMLYSTSAYSAQSDFGNDMYYFSKQALISVASFAFMLFVSRIDYHLYGAFSLEIYVAAMILMALVQTPLGQTINGARRWLKLPGGMSLQPAEITKIAVILYISYELCRLGSKVATREGTIRVFAFGIAAAGGVMFLTDNLSTAIIVMAITCILYFVVHPKLKPFLKLIAGGAAIAAVLVIILSMTLTNSDNFRLQRIITWLNPEAYGDTEGFQVMQGLYAIGSGGFFGKGLGNSTQKLGIVPEVQNDMILTIICEELGVFGAIMILLLFGLMLYRLMFIARNAPDLYGALLATGIFAHIALQVVLNIAVVTNMIPNTGVTLPFISYGGTSILFLMTEMGIALGISRKIRLQEG